MRAFSKKNKNQKNSKVLPDTFAYYFAAVAVCLLIKDNPIKALKSSLRGIVHTQTEWVQSWREDRLRRGL